MAYYEGEVSGIGCNNGGYGMGSGWEGLIGLVLVAGLLGNGNFGGLFGNGRNGVGNELSGWQLGKLATTNDVASGFSTSEIMSDLNSIILGQATMQNFINQGFAGVNQTINSGFAGVDNAICTLGYNTQAGFNGLSRQLAECCCDTRAAIADVKYSNERNTCDIIRAGQDNTRAILDFLTQDKISTLTAENQALKFQASQTAQNAFITANNDAQTAELIRRLSTPCPVPAYVVPNPNCCYNYGVAPVGACGVAVQ